MKILIISRNSFPKQSPRAFRTTELSEQLVKMGHSVTLYTVQGKYDYSSYSKETGIVMKNIKTRHSVGSNDGSGKNGLTGRVLKKLFGRLLYYPDIEFAFLMKGILKAETGVDLLITIAQPHSIHWGVGFAKRNLGDKFPKKWIADCGDPFCGSPFSKWPKYMRYFERKWCSEVDYITVPTENSKAAYFKEYQDKLRVIPQGFDFSKTPIASYKKNSVPTFIFTGTIHPGRSPKSFMDYLLTLDIEYKFYLFMHSPLEEDYVKKSNGKIEYKIGFGRKDIILECSKADFLINVKNISKVQTPSKLIDYGISKRPVLEVSNNFVETNKFESFINGDYSSKMELPDMELYKIENVAKQFLTL